MPRRRKYSSLTSRDIKKLIHPSPVTGMIYVAVVAGVLILFTGIILIILLMVGLNTFFEVPSGFNLGFIIISMLSLLVLTGVSVIGILFVLIKRHNDNVNKMNRSIQVANIDSMTGIEFEHYLKALLANQGYRIQVTQATGDLGVDLIASLNNERLAIQAKRQNSKVSRRAISDAVAGMQHYGCHKAMVISNNYFSPGAVTLAHSTGCILVDRATLAKWVADFQYSNTLANLGENS